MSGNEKTLALLASLVGVRTSGPRKVQRPRAADEILRLRQRLDRAERILAALREPSEKVVEVVEWVTAADERAARNAIRGAVAAAEREVDA